MRDPELWRVIREFPDYSVSTWGHVRNDRTERVMARVRTGGGHIHVGMVKNGVQQKRALAKLVADAYLKRPNPNWYSPTPIYLNGDKNDCDVENLMWRPRWFAMKYNMQFDRAWRAVDPIRDLETGFVFRDIWDELIMVYGLLYSDIVQSIDERTHVFPTFQRFEWA